MNSSQKIIASTLLLTTSFSTIPAQVMASPNSFDQVLVKTQKQQYTEAIQDLEALSRRFQKQGDSINTYRSQATISVLHYYQDSLAERKEKGSNSAKPNWIRFDTCLDSGTKNKEEGCFGASWVTPPTNVKNFGGLVVFDNHLEYFQNSFPIRGILDVAVVPKLRANELVTSLCEINSGARKSQQAFALVTHNVKQDKYTKIRRAWYPDFQTKRLKSIDPKRISCSDPYNPEG